MPDIQIADRQQTNSRNGGQPSGNGSITPDKVVKEWLKIDDFIDKHEEQIFTKLEECDQNIMTALEKGQIDQSQDFVMFMCQALPLISSIIQIGSSLKALNEATDKIREKLSDIDAVSVLSALTFAYIVEVKVWGEFKSSEKEKQWNRIRNRVQKLAT